MPNHVTQVLKVEGSDAFERMRAYFTDFDVQNDLDPSKREQWRGFDFGKIIPRPAIVDTVVEDGADRFIPMLMNTDGAYLLWEQLRTANWMHFKERPLPQWRGFESMREGWMEKHLRATFGDDPVDNAYRMIKCFAETGHKGWYDWANANWGTKWNAYSSDTDPQGEGDSARIKFNTAWAPPEVVLEALAKLEPTLAFDYVAVCEGQEFYALGSGFDGAFHLGEINRDCTRENAEFIAAHVACYGGEPEFYDEEEEADTDAETIQ